MIRTLTRLLAAQLPPTLPDGRDAFTAAADTVLATHPIQIARWLDEIWADGGIASWPLFGTRNIALGDPAVVARLKLPDGLRDDTLRSGIGATPAVPPTIPPVFEAAPAIGVGAALPVPWDHLIYAYLIESTGVGEIFTEVVRRYALGETLDAPSIDTLVWVRGSEELFFRDPPLFSIGGVTSSLRQKPEHVRRNHYWRRLGLDLPFPMADVAADDQPWKRLTGTQVNTRFLELWNELLRQVWMGIENDRNQVGSNPTDPSYLAYLCQTIGEEQRLRRRGGMGAREEFAAITFMSWFHLTLEYDSAVVLNLKATAGGTGNPADRLKAIGQAVGITPPRQARELFELADLMSPLLWFIELDQFSTPADAETLYKVANVANTAVADTMIRIIDLWQSATGTPLKDQAARMSRPGDLARAPAQPVRLPTSAGVAPLPSVDVSARSVVTAGSNGKRT